jgi:hypothetical protein
MSAIISSGRARYGSTIVPHWRWEDTAMDTHTLRVAGWLASHADGWPEAHVTRNMIAKRTGVSAGKVSDSIATLQRLGIVSVKTIELAQHAGGKRWQVTFHFNVWERPDPRSPGDQAPGHVMTTPGHVVTATTAPEKVKQSEVSSSELTLSLEIAPAVDRFPEFWTAYGNLAGTGKKLAQVCWRSAIDRGDDPTAILAGLDAWVRYWRTPGANKAMYAQGFLSQQKWATPPPPIHSDDAGQRRPMPGRAGIEAALERGRLADAQKEIEASSTDQQ